MKTVIVTPRFVQGIALIVLILIAVLLIQQVGWTKTKWLTTAQTVIVITLLSVFAVCWRNLTPKSDLTPTDLESQTTLYVEYHGATKHYLNRFPTTISSFN